MSVKNKYFCDAPGCSYGYPSATEDPVGNGWLVAMETRGHSILVSTFDSKEFDVEMDAAITDQEVLHLCGWSCFQKWAEAKLQAPVEAVEVKA